MTRLSRLVALGQRVPFWGWLLIGAVVVPWYLAYFCLVLRSVGVVAFWVPPQ